MSNGLGFGISDSTESEFTETESLQAINTETRTITDKTIKNIFMLNFFSNVEK
jgi:hypothetical protein